jgi:hypothetical protein
MFPHLSAVKKAFTLPRGAAPTVAFTSCSSVTVTLHALPNQGANDDERKRSHGILVILSGFEWYVNVI